MFCSFRLPERTARFQPRGRVVGVNQLVRRTECQHYQHYIEGLSLNVPVWRVDRACASRVFRFPQLLGSPPMLMLPTGIAPPFHRVALSLLSLLSLLAVVVWKGNLHRAHLLYRDSMTPSPNLASFSPVFCFFIIHCYVSLIDFWMRSRNLVTTDFLERTLVSLSCIPPATMQ